MGGAVTFHGNAKPTATHTFHFAPTVVTVKGTTLRIGHGATLNAAGAEPTAEATGAPGLQTENGAPGKAASMGGIVAAVMFGAVGLL